MIKRSTWVLLAILAVLLAVVLLLPQLKGEDKETPPTSTPTLESPFSFTVGDVVEFEVTGLEGVSVHVKRDENNLWMLVTPDEKTSESNNIEGVVAGVVNLNLITKIEPAPPADVSGLEPPMYIVNMFDKDGDVESINIGTLTPTSSGYYIQTEDGQVFVADKIKIDQVIDLALNPPIFLTATPTTMLEGSEIPGLTPTP